MMEKLNSLTAGVVAIAFFAGCATVAVTGRSQLSLISDNELITAADKSYFSLVNAASEKGAILHASESTAAANNIAMVNRVTQRVLTASGLANKRNWAVVVLKSNVPNAIVFPNGKIIVFTGLLPITQSEAGLAAVLGHEIAHVSSRHAAERISQAILADTVLTTVGTIAAIKSERNQPAISAALGLGLQYGVLMPFSRTHESEADRVGQIYMAKAGYDPKEAVGVWERMAAVSGKSKFEFLSTHPSDETRQKQLLDWLPTAQLFYMDRNRELPKSLAGLPTATNNKLFPIALKPDIKEDYWYKFKMDGSDKEITLTFNRLYDCEFGKCVDVINEKGGFNITSDYRIVKMFSSDGSASMKFSPPWQQVRFPIAVGDSWDSSTILEKDGKKMKGVMQTSIVSYEPIDVAAGKFLAYKTQTSVGGKVIYEGWFAPETRGFVKQIFRDGKGNDSMNITMTDYQRSQDPSGEISKGGVKSN